MLLHPFFLHVKPQLLSENETNGVGYLLIRATYLISVSAEQLAGQLKSKSSLTKN